MFPAEQLMFCKLTLTNSCHQLTFYYLAVTYTTWFKVWFIHECSVHTDTYTRGRHRLWAAVGPGVVSASFAAKIGLLVEVCFISRVCEWYQEHCPPTKFLFSACSGWDEIFICSVCVSVYECSAFLDRCAAVFVFVLFLFYICCPLI